MTNINSRDVDMLFNKWKEETIELHKIKIIIENRLAITEQMTKMIEEDMKNG